MRATMTLPTTLLHIAGLHGRLVFIHDCAVDKQRQRSTPIPSNTRVPQKQALINGARRGNHAGVARRNVRLTCSIRSSKDRNRCLRRRFVVLPGGSCSERYPGLRIFRLRRRHRALLFRLDQIRAYLRTGNGISRGLRERDKGSVSAEAASNESTSDFMISFTWTAVVRPIRTNGFTSRKRRQIRTP
jgi:hypothetical protein